MDAKYVKMVWKWDATICFASLDPFVNEAFLQHQCIMTWKKFRGWRFTHYSTTVARNHKATFFTERGNCTCWYMLEPILLLPSEPLLPCDLAHAHCDVMHDVGARVMSAHFAQNKFGEFEHHILIQCSSFDHIQLWFPHIFNQTQSLHEFLSW